ncbi:hypothetical protein C7B65_21150 [Phormidesmis priestleyi ULC007]|uniref:Serine protease n=1 Tax=Phormidesmis priestleyi ULC007 TaxID=1920490 RepID=A0A2T1D859_9CYAN|nr:trypsin-like peptidase domain-containing protein [Phormidesmis priestleyi]PSB16634.1 hypothetical protein C7B65_21150 [Phormidesmis priestleyi ULC007]PZO47536.1 MAG: hypothetical protein DCF14_19685 [Phormidesmis priestleyi]
MTLQFFPRSSKLVRFAITGLMATQAAIATTVISEFTLTTPGIDSTRAALAKSERLSGQDIYRKAAPAVVYIETEQGTGSGVIIDANGLIVTNAHVVEGAQQVAVELADGRKFMAQVVSQGTPGCVDLAVLKIQATKLPTINFAAASSVEKGQEVFAIGYPKGTKPSSITRGGVSNVSIDQGRIDTDVTLNPGNSGGALLNDRGELLGINTGGRRDATGMNFAIAANKVQALVQALKQGLSPILGQYVSLTTSSSHDLAAKLLLNGAVNNGTLQKSDNLMCGDKSRADLYTFKGDADQPVKISMTSSQIGSYLVLLGPNGEVVAERQSKERGGTATMLAKLPVAGTYTVIANALHPEQLGAYQLQATVPLLFEQGRLTRTSPQLQDGSPYSSYRFTGQANQTIALTLYQFDFDPYLILLDSEGKKVVEGKADRQSKVDIKLPRNGSYTLIVSTVNPNDRGRFLLSIQPSEETASPNAVSQNR